MSIPVYILKRILQAIPLLFIISVMSFVMLAFSPIDPLASLKANPSISQSTIDAEKRRLGLDKPPVVQYFYWVTSVMRGELGVSTTGGSVTILLFQRAGNTALLGIFTLIFTWLIAIPAGIYAAINRNTWVDKTFGILTAIGMSMPTFLMALLMLMFALQTRCLPIGGITSPDFFSMGLLDQIKDVTLHLVIPTAVLTFVGLAAIQRQMRGNLLEVLREEYVRTARAKGLPEERVIYVHALRNAINPLITLLGFEFATLLSGAALTETVVAYPGLGRLTLEAVLTKDMNLVMASLMLGAVMLILGNLFADVLLKLVDPRIVLE
jgi:peptide/nickel transport system permease protein